MLARLQLAIAVFAVACLALAATEAKAQQRLALLVGNAAYPGTPANPSGWLKLDNPVNDVTLVADALKSIGFDVTLVKDGTRASMQSAIDSFAARTKGADIVLFYFAGHGFEHDRRNYLVPVDAPAKANSGELANRFIDFERAANALTQAKTTIFLLDACRTDASFVSVAQTTPLAPSVENATTALGDQDGLRGTVLSGTAKAAVMRAGMNDYDYPPGAQVAVLYSTGRGVPARDSVPPPLDYSPFAWEVAKRIVVPHVEISAIFNTIRQGVYERTRMFEPPQAPYTYNSLAPEIYLHTGTGPSASAPLPLPDSPPTRLNISESELETTDETTLVVRVLSEHSVDDIQRLAERGDPIATYMLGYMQEFGLGVPRDLAKARATLEKAASYGTPSGQLELAYFLQMNARGPEDLERSLSFYKAAAEQGFAKARGHYARVLMSSPMVPRTMENYEAGLAQLRLAAAEDYPYAIYSLARAGNGQEKAIWEARLRAMADAGDLDSEHWLCQFDVENAEYAKAIPHCRKAAIAGFADSQAYMARAANEGWVTPRDPQEAMHWLRQAMARPNELDPGLRAQMASLRVELSALKN